MKRLALFLALAASAHAAPPESFFRALHLVETNGVRKQVPIWFRGNRVSYVG